jgi:hypothetical protein
VFVAIVKQVGEHLHQTLYTHHAQRLNNQFVLLRTEHARLTVSPIVPPPSSLYSLISVLLPATFVFFTYPYPE